MKTPIRSRFPAPVHVAALCVTIFALACEGTVTPPEPPETTTEVDVLDNEFTPTANAVDIGATVTWTWGGANVHNVTFDDPAVGTSVTQPAGTFERTFDEAGEFTYFCSVHGRSVMSGRVIVGG